MRLRKKDGKTSNEGGRRQWTNRRARLPPSLCKTSCTSWQLMAFLGVEQVTFLASSTLAPNTGQRYGDDKEIESGHSFINIRSGWAALCSQPKKKPRRTVDLTALPFPHHTLLHHVREPHPQLYVSGERGEIERITLSRVSRWGASRAGQMRVLVMQRYAFATSGTYTS